MNDVADTTPDGGHSPVAGHQHAHDRWCGHPALPHEDHIDFLHDGHVHHPCSGHVDDVSGAVDAGHLPHVAHMHVHQDDCGHEAVTHDDHIDFKHGQHRHASHQSHYDEH